MTTVPKAFLSHSSADKERFVVPFATKLRQNGVEVWLDQWEMLPGDSLVDKIFEEGLKDADVFLIVLSVNSINSDWVKKELNTAQVKHIGGKCRIIPVVIDGVKVPESLIETIYQSIKNTDSYDDEFRRILASIFGHNEKPALGSPPTYARDVLKVPSGLTELDYFLLKRIFETCLEENNLVIPYTDPFLEEAVAKGWAMSDAEDSLIHLVERYYLEGAGTRENGRGPDAANPTMQGWDVVFQSTRPDYKSLLVKLAFHLVNETSDHEGRDGRHLTEYLGESQVFTFHLLDVLESSGFIKLSKTLGPTYYVLYVSPQLKRALQNGQF